MLWGGEASGSFFSSDHWHLHTPSHAAPPSPQAPLTCKLNGALPCPIICSAVCIPFFCLIASRDWSQGAEHLVALIFQSTPNVQISNQKMNPMKDNLQQNESATVLEFNQINERNSRAKSFFKPTLSTCLRKRALQFNFTRCATSIVALLLTVLKNCQNTLYQHCASGLESLRHPSYEPRPIMPALWPAEPCG